MGSSRSLGSQEDVAHAIRSLFGVGVREVPSALKRESRLQLDFGFGLAVLALLGASALYEGRLNYLVLS